MVRFGLVFLFSIGAVTGVQSLPHLSKEYTSPDGQKVLVFDGAIPEERLLALKVYAAVEDNWRFLLPDKYVQTNQAWTGSNDGIPWKSFLDPSLLRSTNVGQEMEKIVQAVDAEIHGKSDSEVEMNEVYSALIRRGDQTKVHRTEEARGASYTMAIYNNVVWRKNSYGETMFYDDDGEIFAVIRSKFGRLVVWDSSIPFIFRPPSITQLSCQHIFIASFSDNNDKNKQKRLASYNLLESIKNVKEDFACTGSANQSSNIDPEKHLTLLRKNRAGHIVAVFDELFPEADLLALREWTITYGKYYFDDSVDVTSDNVQWIAGIVVSDFVRSRFWPVIKQLAEYISGKDTWYPYDVACNLIRSTDHTRFHLDTSYMEQEEITFLLYLSPDWTADDYGETAFMETNDDSPVNEYVAEVVPYHGRAVLFDGNFPHSARPPAAMHYDARYTLAVKLAVTKTDAMQKMFKEEPRHEQHMYEALQELQQGFEDSRTMVAKMKIGAVSSFLMTKNVQKQLTGQTENKDDDDNDKPQAEIEPGEEREAELSAEDMASLKEMASFHGVEYSDPDQEEEVATVLNRREDEIFAPDRRQKVIKHWIRTAKTPEELDDYLELYLRQRRWFKDYASKRVLSLM